MSAIFRYVVAGFPVPELKFTKDWKEITPENSDVTFQFDEATQEHKVIFHEVTPKDAGKYLVIAKNESGEVKQAVTLLVTPRPPEELMKRKMSLRA